jgi:hypothetical protein
LGIVQERNLRILGVVEFGFGEGIKDNAEAQRALRGTQRRGRGMLLLGNQRAGHPQVAETCGLAGKSQEHGQE